MSKLLHNGAPIRDGELLRDGRGLPWRFVRIAAERVPGKSGKVEVIAGWDNIADETQARTLYVTVFPALSWSDDD